MCDQDKLADTVFFLQEFFDQWPVLMGEVPPYAGPKTPDGRVWHQTQIYIFCFPIINAPTRTSSATLMFCSSISHKYGIWKLFVSITPVQKQQYVHIQNEKSENIWTMK